MLFHPHPPFFETTNCVLWEGEHSTVDSDTKFVKYNSTSHIALTVWNWKTKRMPEHFTLNIVIQSSQERVQEGWLHSVIFMFSSAASANRMRHLETFKVFSSCSALKSLHSPASLCRWQLLLISKCQYRDFLFHSLEDDLTSCTAVTLESFG